jgi:hypothetical protein
MSEELDPKRKFRLNTLANEFLLRAALIRLMLLDPGFANGARQWLDTIFGQLSTSELADKTNPQVMSALREMYLRHLARAEEFALSVPKAAPPSSPKSIRRRIFEWFERA